MAFWALRKEKWWWRNLIKVWACWHANTLRGHKSKVLMGDLLAADRQVSTLRAQICNTSTMMGALQTLKYQPCVIPASQVTYFEELVFNMSDFGGGLYGFAVLKYQDQSLHWLLQRFTDKFILMLKVPPQESKPSSYTQQTFAFIVQTFGIFIMNFRVIYIYIHTYTVLNFLTKFLPILHMLYTMI